MSMERRKTMKLEKEAVQLRPLLEEIAAAQRMRGDKAITIEIKGDDNVSVESDKTHLSNVLNNLIDNAIKYSGDRVRIVMTYDADGLSIADDGIGIPQNRFPICLTSSTACLTATAGCARLRHRALLCQEHSRQDGMAHQCQEQGGRGLNIYY